MPDSVPPDSPGGCRRSHGVQRRGLLALFANSASSGVPPAAGSSCQPKRELAISAGMGLKANEVLLLVPIHPNRTHGL